MLRVVNSERTSYESGQLLEVRMSCDMSFLRGANVGRMYRDKHVALGVKDLHSPWNIIRYSAL